jgi:hypothetical protein
LTSRETLSFGTSTLPLLHASLDLQRCHDIQISSSGVWRILKRLELNRLPASQRHKRHDRRWQRYEKPLHGHRGAAGCEVHRRLLAGPAG